jgi:hypothetical protein
MLVEGSTKICNSVCKMSYIMVVCARVKCR